MKLFLRRLLTRSLLDDDERNAVLSLTGRPESIESNRDIVHPGAASEHACLVASGIAARFDQMRDGRRQIVALYIPGDVCDLHSVPVPTTGWGLQALGTTNLLLIEHKELRDVIQAKPRVGMAFWRDTVADGSMLAKAVANIGRQRAQARVAHLLCELGARMELAGLSRRVKYSLPATQAHLADVVGLTPVHLNRTLKALKSEGMLLSSGEVRIEDWAHAVKVADFDPAYLLLPRTTTSGLN